jgi:hypothetical protein
MGVDCLAHFIPEKLTLAYIEGVTGTEPVIPRRYTLTHSDITGELYLAIGKQYAWDKINPKRDEVLGEWRKQGNSLYYCVYLHIDEGQFSQDVSAKRIEIFRRELPLALSAIRYGDRLLFDTYPMLEHASIIVTFMSTYPQLAKQENWGQFYRFVSPNNKI